MIDRRRRALVFVAALFPIMSFPWPRGGESAVKPNSATLPANARALLRRLSAIGSDMAALRDVGWRYLRAYPEEADARRLAALTVGAPDSGPRRDLKRRLAARRQADFAADDIVIVDGWILSRTEGRVGALALLLSEGHDVS